MEQQNLCESNHNRCHKCSTYYDDTKEGTQHCCEIDLVY